jgi:hypothetical protein
MPKSAGAGWSVRLTLLPECNPIPTQEMCRRTVRCASISLSGSGGRSQATQQRRCLQSRLAGGLANILESQNVSVEQRKRTRPGDLNFVVRKPQPFPPRLLQLYHKHQPANGRIERCASCRKRSPRKRPVADRAFAATPSGVPDATMRPPSVPPSGPRSIT